MRPSLRFLAFALVGWVSVRAATISQLPDAKLFSVAQSKAPVPAVTPTSFPPIEPVTPSYAGMQPTLPPGYLTYPAPQMLQVSLRPVAIPVHYPVPQPIAPVQYPAISPALTPAFYAPPRPLDDWARSGFASASFAPLGAMSRVPAQSLPAAPPPPPRLDRLQLTSWALLRGRQGEPFGPSSLANGGQLGGSQAGARLSYNFTRQLAATLRTSSDIGRRGGEVAAGIRVRPITGLPLWLTAERRQRIGRLGTGRNAFALFAESGVYGQSLPLQFQLDGYLQGGVVGLHRRDLFIDGAATMTRPLFAQFSAGVGFWGGAQPGVYRFDAGPRVSMKVRNGMRVHFDWRQRIVGNAAPGSGPAVTLAGDF